MSLFFGGEKKEAVLFSPLEGKITFEGKPAAGAKINLWIKWKDAKGENFEFTSDKNGYFQIPQQITTYKENPLAQIVITQEITVEYERESYLIWTLSKTNTHLYGELGGKPQNVTCELTTEEMDAHLENTLMGTLCKWDQLIKKDGK